MSVPRGRAPRGQLPTPPAPLALAPLPDPRQQAQLPFPAGRRRGGRSEPGGGARPTAEAARSASRPPGAHDRPSGTRRRVPSLRVAVGQQPAGPGHLHGPVGRFPAAQAGGGAERGSARRAARARRRGASGGRSAIPAGSGRARRSRPPSPFMPCCLSSRKY